ncbi:hypothetical protein [Oribacterium sp. FC2011]|nr:hypothetical protein [Oribacterium sp. FC2011]
MSGEKHSFIFIAVAQGRQDIIKWCKLMAAVTGSIFMVALRKKYHY